MAGIFISYRHVDIDTTFLLQYWLKEHFGQGLIFWDKQDLPATWLLNPVNGPQESSGPSVDVLAFLLLQLLEVRQLKFRLHFVAFAPVDSSHCVMWLRVRGIESRRLC